tara:strand:+ start:112 stop:627 length:516 start_codon:yes stop_codon:yes gene_type:complete
VRAGDNKPLENANKGYRTRDGKQRSVNVQVHPDPRVQKLLEQIRESESVQGIDRLRLLRDNRAGTDRQVFILSSVPVDVTVDHLWGWKRLQSVLALVEEADGLLPLNPKHMMKRCPLLATSERTVKGLVSELKRARFLIGIYIRDVALYNYRTKGQKRPSEALVWADVDPS